MIGLLLSVLFLQGVPVQQPGTVTGVLRLADGKPAAGVRIAAVSQTAALEETAAGPTLSSITETDAQGRYRLDNVPPGRYFIAAGRLDLMTYYPGTPNMVAGQTVLVTAGSTVTSIDFVLNASSAGRADPGAQAGTILLRLPLDVRVEGGGRLPLLTEGKTVTIQFAPLTGTTPPTSLPINSTHVDILAPIADYRVTVENLPAGYNVKSIKADSTELPDRILTLTRTGLTSGTGTVWATSAAYTLMMTTRATGTTTPIPTLSIVLDRAAAPRSTGVRVAGSLPPNTIRTLYLGNWASTVFSGGTFEFRNVLPGRYVIATRDNMPGSLATTIVVGTGDLNNVSVSNTAVLPRNAGMLLASASADSRSPGIVPLASLRGRILDSETGMPVRAGSVWIVGDTWTKLELGEEGRFEFPRLLPGNYELEVQGVGYPTLRRAIVVEEKDLDLDLKLS